MSRFRRVFARSSNERGTSLIEAAVVLPFLIAVVIGLAEFGFFFVDSLPVSTSAKQGARVGSTAGKAPSADAVIVDTVNESVASASNSSIKAIWVFKADAAGDPVDGCTVDTNPPYYFNCPGGTANIRIYAPDGTAVAGSWVSSGRNNTMGNNCPAVPSACPDRIGVRVVYTHNYITSLLPLPQGPFSEDAIFQIEPNQGY